MRKDPLFVPHNIAKILREEKFNEQCFGYYDENGEFQFFETDDLMSVLCKNFVSEFSNNTNSEMKAAYPTFQCTAPLYQQVVDWFRNKHKIHIGFVPYYDYFYYHIKDFNKDIEIDSSEGLEFSYYETYEQAINEALKLIKK